MTSPDPKAELLQAGIEGYLDARRAMDEFEQIVIRLVKQVMSRHQSELEKSVLGTPDIASLDIDRKDSDDSIGVKYQTNDFWILVGIRWQKKDGNPPTPVVFLAVRLFAAYKQNQLKRALGGQKTTEEIARRNLPTFPYDIEFSKAIQSKATEDQLEEMLETVISYSIDILANIPGGLKATTMKKQQPVSQDTVSK